MKRKPTPKASLDSVIGEEALAANLAQAKEPAYWRKIFIQSTAIVALAVFLGVVSNAVRSTSMDLGKPYTVGGSVGRMNALSAKEWLGEAIFIDMRSSITAFQDSHIPGAVQVSLTALTSNPQVIETRFGSTYRSLTFIVYCNQDCTRADQAASILVKVGAYKVYVLEGGFPAWINSALPVEKGSREGIMATSAGAEND